MVGGRQERTRLIRGMAVELKALPDGRTWMVSSGGRGGSEPARPYSGLPTDHDCVP